MMIYHEKVTPHTARMDARRSMAVVTSGKIENDPYVVIESFEPEDKNSEELKINSGDFVNVITKQPSGWWFVQLDGTEKFGWVPANYLESETGKIEAVDKKFEAGAKYLTKEKYDSKLEDEISFPENAIVIFMESSWDGWPVIEYNGKIGRAPAVLLEKYNDNILDKINPAFIDSINPSAKESL